MEQLRQAVDYLTARLHVQRRDRIDEWIASPTIGRSGRAALSLFRQPHENAALVAFIAHPRDQARSNDWVLGRRVG